ncbi:Transposase [Azospirillum palustre]
MMRYKQVISRSLRAQTLPTQKVEAAVGCKVLKIMATLGMPVSRKGA